MSIDDWTTRQRWLYAIKPASWPKLLVPMALGQALGIVTAGEVNLAALVIGFLFTIFDGLFIVFMNDWGDQEVDRIKRRMFPDGCSPKTITDGVLPAKQVFAAGITSGALAIAVAFVGVAWLGREWAGVLGVIAVATFVAYTLPPLKLNYRGGGEILEAFGVGAILPILNAYLQSGALWGDYYSVLTGFFALSMASALASGLSDEESDRAGGKRTFTTMWGNDAVRRGSLLCAQAGGLVYALGAAPPPVALAACATVFYHLMKASEPLERARTNAFVAIKTYKMHLHHAIWYGTLALATGLLLYHHLLLL